MPSTVEKQQTKIITRFMMVSERENEKFIGTR